MLIATITALILIFGSGNLEFYLTNLKKPVKEYVVDEVRRDAILEAGKELEEELKGLSKDIEEHFEELIEVHAEYKSATGGLSRCRCNAENRSEQAHHARPRYARRDERKHDPRRVGAGVRSS